MGIMASLETIAWMLIVPAAAECVASVWTPEIIVFGLDFQLAWLNITGALLEGFFAAWDSGRASPAGPMGAMLQDRAPTVRGYFLSVYTSWAGMVGKGAWFAFMYGSTFLGIVYMCACITAAVVAEAIGGAIAVAMGSRGPSTAPAIPPTGSRATLLAALVAFVAYTYLMVKHDEVSFSDADVVGGKDELPSLISGLDAEENRLVVAIACSIAGAFTGNALGDFLDSRAVADKSAVNFGTLGCNFVFAVLGLTLNSFTLHKARYGRSVILQSFSGSFCGSASAFNGHASDTTELLRSSGRRRALVNTAANLGLAMVVFLVALHLEHLIQLAPSIDVTADGRVDAYELLAHYGLAAPPPPPPSKHKPFFFF